MLGIIILVAVIISGATAYLKIKDIEKSKIEQQHNQQIEQQENIK